MTAEMFARTLVLTFILAPLAVAQSDQELLDFQGEVSLVDVGRSRITVVGSDGEEVVFNVTEETEITYTDPETDETEELSLGDIDVGETVHLRYSISDETHWAWEIEVRPTPPAY